MLTLYFPDNWGDDETKIQYIGFKGEITINKRQAIKNVVYEVMPSAHDAKVQEDAMAAMGKEATRRGFGAGGGGGGAQ